MSYEEAIGWLYGTQLHGIKLGLENIRRLVSALSIRTWGEAAPLFIHVAGTNGKGSTCAFLDAICRAAGCRTGLFTSPHLVTFRERIRINGEMISGTDVAAGLEEIRELTGDWEHSPTFFEITTALALAHFQRAGAEVVILETGMGGRLDATNVVTPAVSVITRIDLDHQQWLGSSLAEIAFEKGGIIKPEVPVVTTPQEDEVRCMLVHLAMERGATYHEVVTPIRRLPLALTGRQQQWNAALAVHALELAGIEAESSAIAQGLASAEWPGRFQRVGDRLVLDGAHNPSAATQLVETWREIFPDKKATLVLGAARDKDLRSICSILAPIAARAIVVPLQNERSCSVEELSTAIREAAPDLPVSTATNFNAARAEAEFYAERILITGSFFLIGEALAHLGERTEPLELSVQ